MQEKDRNQNGKLTIEQVRDIYRIYKVELDEKTLKKYFEESDELNKDDFIKLATETKLTEFHAGDAVFSSKGFRLTDLNFSMFDVIFTLKEAS